MRTIEGAAQEFAGFRPIALDPCCDSEILIRDRLEGEQVAATKSSGSDDSATSHVVARNRPGKLLVVTGGLGATAAFFANVGSAYDWFERRLGQACAAISIESCSQPEPARNIPADVPRTPPPAGGLAVSFAGSNATDRDIANALNTFLAAEMGPSQEQADGYTISGQVTEGAIGPSGETLAKVEWSLSRGLVTQECRAVPVTYRNSMKINAVRQLAGVASVALAESVRYQDVRCPR